MIRTLASALFAFATLVLPSATVFAQATPQAPIKKRVAIGRFEAVGSFTQAYGGWDVGQALAAQLATELVATGRFIVVERARLGDALREQELGMVGVTTGETSAEAGQVLGAQLLVYGVVTQFDLASGGNGVQLGLGLGGASLGLGGKKETGHVAIDLRLVDASTGAVIEARRAEAKVSQRSVSADLRAGPMSLGKTEFNRTALGKAAEQVIADVVRTVASRMDATPWTGRIVEVGEDEVYVSGGRDVNLAVGQRFVVSAVARQLVDPATGARLGQVERRVGEIEIARVEDQFSIARPLEPMSVSRGDIVRVASAAKPAGPGARTGLIRPAVQVASHTTPALDAVRQVIQDRDAAAAASAAGLGMGYTPGLGAPGLGGYPGPAASGPGMDPSQPPTGSTQPPTSPNGSAPALP
jgi:curli biogenesis system outer membrane secretion channel CsgG